MKFILTRYLDLKGSGSALRNEFNVGTETLIDACRAMFAALVWMLSLRIGKPSVASGGFKKSVVLPTSFLKFDKRGCTFSTQLLHATLLYKGSRWALGFLITSCAMLLDKMLPGFLFEAGIEIVIDSCCATFAEIHKRGKDLWDEFKSYVADLLAMLAPYARTGNQSVASGLNNSLVALPSRRFLPCSLDKDIAPPVMAIRQGKIQEKSQASHLFKKEHPAKDQACHHCGVIGHWKRNCLAYLAELKKGKSGSSNPGPRRSRKLNKTAKDQACHHCGVIGHWKRNCLAYLAELKKGKSGSSNPGT